MDVMSKKVPDVVVNALDLEAHLCHDVVEVVEALLRGERRVDVLHRREGRRVLGGVQFNRHFEFWAQKLGAKLGPVLGQLQCYSTTNLDVSQESRLKM